uniref:Uncharacterized protein n=1 Tax=viral metagenome TaxID=1070528 RepID=A0A6C0ETW6_9ZZZZ
MKQNYYTPLYKNSNYNNFNSFNGLGMFNYFNRSFNTIKHVTFESNESFKVDESNESFKVDELVDPIESFESLYSFFNDFIFLLKLKFTLICKRLIPYNSS